MNKKGGTKAEERDYTSKNMILGVSLIAIGVIVICLIIFFGGLRAGIENLSNGGGYFVTSKEMVNVAYEKELIYYNSNHTADDDEDYSSLLSEFDPDGQTNFRVIKSRAKLQDLCYFVQDFNSGSEVCGMLDTLDNDFFISGSVIAATIEGEAIGDEVRVMNVYRNENYDIRIDLDDQSNCSGVCRDGALVLIKVQNIQPKHVEIQRRSNWTEAQYNYGTDCGTESEAVDDDDATDCASEIEE